MRRPRLRVVTWARIAPAVLTGLCVLGAVRSAPSEARALPAASDPLGAYDLASAQPGLVRVAGWSFDPAAPTTPIQMHVYVGGPAGTAGAEGHPFVASLARPDVAAAHPEAGP